MQIRIEFVIGNCIKFCFNFEASLIVRILFLFESRNLFVSSAKFRFEPNSSSQVLFSIKRF